MTKIDFTFAFHGLDNIIPLIGICFIIYIYIKDKNGEA